MQRSRRVVVLGSGFAGVWAALGAARLGRERGADGLEVLVVSRAPFHDIRVRNYEQDLEACRIPLEEVLDPVGVTTVIGSVAGIDAARRVVLVEREGARREVPYDRLVVATGSRLRRPAIPGLAEFGFDVDTFDAAARLRAHLETRARVGSGPGAATVLVVGGGLTGIEVATELEARLRRDRSGPERASAPRVLLVDHHEWVGSDLGADARPVVDAALARSGVETRTGVGVVAVTAEGATLSTGEFLDCETVVWCAGMTASPVAGLLGIPLDRLGRLPVDEFLRVKGVAGVFAAGDVASAPIDDGHVSVMSCQHARPMGRFAGHNAAADLLGVELLPLRIPWYVTVLDLGDEGALYTEGWDRRVVATGAVAKETKRTINRARIYPPRSGDPAEILAAAAPIVQAPPSYGA